MNKNKEGIVPENEKKHIRVGPDREFFRGKPLRSNDKGGCYAAFGRVPGERLLAIDFGTELQWMAAPPEAALQQAEAFRKKVHGAFGEMSTDASTFPMKVIANKEDNVVETHFPQTLGVLAANPELFLVWADKLEEAAKQLAPAA